MPQRASNYEFTNRLIHKAKRNPVSGGGLPLLFADDFSAYSNGKLAAATGNVWESFSGITSGLSGVQDVLSHEINSNQITNIIQVGSLNRYAVHNAAFVLDTSADYIVEATVRLSGIIGEQVGLLVEVPASNTGIPYMFLWRNINLTNDVSLFVNGEGTVVNNLSYLTPTVPQVFIVRIEFILADSDWHVYINDTLQHVINRPFIRGPGMGYCNRNYDSATHGLGDMTFDNYSIRGSVV